MQAKFEAGDKGAAVRALRALLAEKFPSPSARANGVFPVALGGGQEPEQEPERKPELELPRGRVTEATGSTGSGALFLEALLKAVTAARGMMALVDGTGGYDPAGETGRLLWVLCQGAQAAIRAADLLLRDGNLPLVVLDLLMNPAAELRRIPAATWYRFQRILEHSTTVFVVLTPKPLVSSAAERLLLRNRWTLHALRQPRAKLSLELERVQRGQSRAGGAGRMGGGLEFFPRDRQIA